MKPHIQIILSSTRQNRAGEKVANWVQQNLKNDDRATLELLDLKDYKLPYYEEPLTPKMMAGKYTNELVKKWVSKVSQADGYIVVTPEYNHGYSSILKTALDYPYYEWNNKPIAFVSYGGLAGGARAVEQLRLVAIELQMAPIREAVVIPRVSSAFDEAGNMKEEFYNKQLANLFEQLLWWANALKTAREVKVS